MNFEKQFFQFFLFIFCFVGLAIVATATVPVPSGFYRIVNQTGVQIYQKDYAGGSPDYVIVLDLRYGTLRNFTGSVSGPVNLSTVERRSLLTHYNNAKAQDTTNRKVVAVLNGTFFATNDNPTGIAFGLKADWWRISYGYGVATEYPGLIRTIAFDSAGASASIRSYAQSTFDGSSPNVVGGLDVTASKSPTSYIGRTFAGVRDDNGDGKSETVIFYSSSKATQSLASSVLSGFGVSSKIMFDGGGSTGLIINGSTKSAAARTIPQAFVICSGR